MGSAVFILTPPEVKNSSPFCQTRHICLWSTSKARVSARKKNTIRHIESPVALFLCICVKKILHIVPLKASLGYRWKQKKTGPREVVPSEIIPHHNEYDRKYNLYVYSLRTTEVRGRTTKRSVH